MRLSLISYLSPLCLAALAKADDVSTRPGPFRLVTTANTSTPVNPTGNVLIYYLNATTLNIYNTHESYWSAFQLYNGVLGSFARMSSQAESRLPGMLT